jgi:hypothetical protein
VPPAFSPEITEPQTEKGKGGKQNAIDSGIRVFFRRLFLPDMLTLFPPLMEPVASITCFPPRLFLFFSRVFIFFSLTRDLCMRKKKDLFRLDFASYCREPTKGKWRCSNSSVALFLPSLR